MGRSPSQASFGDNSTRSSKSATYRTVAKASFVDDALFGGSHRGVSATRNDHTGNDQSPTAPHGRRLYRSPLVKRERMPEVVQLPESTVQRMRGDAPVTTLEQVAAMRVEVEARKEHERAAARARKEKMLRLEAEARTQVPPSESELVQAAADGATLDHACALLQEEKDEVKHMTQLVRHAKCMAVRDMQVQERRAAQAAEQEEQQRLDLQMEIERLRALEALQARDVQRREEQERGAAVLQQQLEERHRQRLREEELRDQERQAMASELERLAVEEAAAAATKRARAAALMEEVATANMEQIERKQRLARQEAQEEERIAEYIRAKDAREQALAAEREAVARAKEFEVARLRAMQEKQADHRSEQDELRARRYQEAKDREWRARERAAAERQAALMADLAAARKAQMQRQVVARAAMAEVERAEFDRILTVSRERQAAERSQAMVQHTLTEAYKRDLLGQIQGRIEAARAERQSYLEEGRRMRQAQAQEKAVLERIKAAKLAELAAEGVPGKYVGELARMRITGAK